MTRFFIHTFLLCIVIVLSSQAQTQPSPIREVFQSKSGNNDIIHKTPILIRTYPVYQDNQNYRVYFLIEIQYDFLQFIYDEGVFRAKTEFEIDIADSTKNLFKSDLFQTNLQVDNFESTNKKDLYHFTCDSFDIEPGRYKVELKYRDLNGNRNQRSFRFQIHLATVDHFYASPVLFTYPEKKYSGIAEISLTQPSALRSYWDFNTDMGIQLHTWQEQSTDPLKVQFSILDEKGKQTIFSMDTLLTDSSQNKTAFLRLSRNLFLEQKYEFQIKYLSPSDAIEQKFPVKIVWFEKPFGLWDLKMAVEPLQYLMQDEKEYENFKQGNNEELQAKFNAFWKERDPTPETPFNDLEYEFYSRVDSANIKYSRKRIPGWTTDIGRIYILYGPPDEVVDNSLAPIKEPFLRWIYNRNDKQLSFTFLALDGRKRYKLANVEENPLQ